MKKTIDAFEYSNQICKALRKGILLTTKSGNTINTMTIGWGKIGIEWNRPVFIAYVRESRYTKELLDENPEFTVNVPIGNADSQILRLCGTQSGRTTNKIQKLGLTLVESDVVGVPGILQMPLTLECKVIYRQKQDLSQLSKVILDRFYPELGSDGFRDPHIAYYGEIVNAYIAEE